MFEKKLIGTYIFIKYDNTYNLWTGIRPVQIVRMFVNIVNIKST